MKNCFFWLHVVTLFIFLHEQEKEISSGWLKKGEKEKKTNEVVGF